MFLRTQPGSPPGTAAYTTTAQTPASHDPIRTPLKRNLRSPAHAFPPELGSSSPPMSSPTSYRDHPSFCSDGASSARSTMRINQSSAGMFAARARAVQPPLQRSSSLVHGTVVSGSSGSSGFAQADPQQHLRYGPRPEMRKAMTGGKSFSSAAGDPVSSFHSSKSTGYSLFYKPTLQDRTHARSSRSQSPSFSTLLPPMNLSTTAVDQSIQGSMWKGRFRQRCLAVSRKREEKDRMSRTAERVNEGFGSTAGGGHPMTEQVESDIEEEAEHEEIFRRMIQKEHRRAAHRMAVSFEQEVGGSDPAVWEAELLEAEGMPLDTEATMTTGAERPQCSTPAKPLSSQWQYRSATKRPLHGTQRTGSGRKAFGDGSGPLRADTGSANALLQNNGFLVENDDDDDDDDDDEEDDQQTREQVEQYARFLQAQEDDDYLLAEYAAAQVTGAGGLRGQGTPPPLKASSTHSAQTDAEAEAGAADTPGAELNIEMEGFTWEDAPLSDDDDVGGGGRVPLLAQAQEDVEMV